MRRARATADADSPPGARSAAGQPQAARRLRDHRAAGRQNGRPAPITVYRALDFLRENGLVHRIESRNAFVACVPQSCRRRSCGVSDLRALRRRRRGAWRRGRRSAQIGVARRRFCPQEPVDRDRRHLLALPRATIVRRVKTDHGAKELAWNAGLFLVPPTRCRGNRRHARALRELGLQQCRDQGRNPRHSAS